MVPLRGSSSRPGDSLVGSNGPSGDAGVHGVVRLPHGGRHRLGGDACEGWQWPRTTLSLWVWAVLQGLSWTASSYPYKLWTTYLNVSARSGRDAPKRSSMGAKAVLGNDLQDIAEVMDAFRAQLRDSPSERPATSIPT